jgi:hypothetical protein
LALSTGVLRGFNGQLVFGAGVAERLRTYGARWIRGLPVYFSDHVFSDGKEYMARSMLDAISRSTGLTKEQEVFLAHESYERLLDFLLDLGTAAGVLQDRLDVVKVSEEMGAEMDEWISRINELNFFEEAGGDPRTAVTLLFVELIRGRLISRVPEMASFAEPLGIVIHETFGYWTGPNVRGEQDSSKKRIRRQPSSRTSRSRITTA